MNGILNTQSEPIDVAVAEPEPEPKPAAPAEEMLIVSYCEAYINLYRYYVVRCKVEVFN